MWFLLSFVDDYCNRFKELPPLELDPLETPEPEKHEEPDEPEEETNLDELNILDRTILQMKEKYHPKTKTVKVGMFAVLVQNELSYHCCLADIENRIRQLQMNGWRIKK